MTERYETRASTHADDCWSWGPGHYGCAVREIHRLREALRDAATSMQTIADKAGRDEYLMTTGEVRALIARVRANPGRTPFKRDRLALCDAVEALAAELDKTDRRALAARETLRDAADPARAGATPLRRRARR